MKFKSEDFNITSELAPEAQAAAQANKALEAHLATLPKVYGNRMGNWYQEAPGQKSTLSTTALLWGITEIEKNCEHEPSPHWVERPGSDLKPIVSCVNCGVKLKVKWEKA